MSFLHCFITAQCFQNELGLNCTTASISLPWFGYLKGEGDCQHVWWLLTRGARGSLQQKEGVCPTGPSGQHSEEQSHGCSSLSVQPASLVQVWDCHGKRKHSRRIVSNLRRPGVKEESSRHSRLKFAADLWDACPQQLLLLHLPFERLSPSPPLLFSCFISSLSLIPHWGPLLGKTQLKSGQLLLSCMNSVDTKCWLENVLCWCFIGSGWFLGAEWGGSNWQNHSLAWKRKNEIPPLKLHTS